MERTTNDCPPGLRPSHQEYRIVFGIGSDKDGKPISGTDRENALGWIKGYCLLAFGGYTLSDTDGGWYDPDSDTVHQEPGCTLSILLPTTEQADQRIRQLAANERAERIKQLALHVRRELRQASVVVILPDNSAAFV